MRSSTKPRSIAAAFEAGEVDTMSRETTGPICKIVHRHEWHRAESTGVFSGAGLDLEDGYIHLCSAAQAADVLDVHFADQDDLLLVVLDPDRTTGTLKWEISRDGKAFPHLYGNLPMTAVIEVHELALVAGRHQLPVNISGN
jgi:uncharacterized protein (DUF952 family)